MATYRRGDSDLGDGTGPQGMNNNIESVWNRRTDCDQTIDPFCNMTLFGQASCEGAAITFGSQPGPAGQRNLSDAWRNRASSIGSRALIFDC